jgi:hypothetical protein
MKKAARMRLAWRSCLGAVPFRDRGGGGLSGAAHVDGIDLRIWVAGGVWRILREFEKRGLPMTIFGVATALQRSPDVTQAFQELGHEIACHG